VVSVEGEGLQSGKDEPGGAMVDCDDAVHQLYHYLDGELTDQRRIEIARHLDLCAPCGRAVVFEAELRQVIANRCQDRVPESLMRRVAQSIEAEQSGGTSGRTVAPS
jgi:mycothiol system anti-sigma-R factor